MTERGWWLIDLGSFRVVLGDKADIRYVENIDTLVVEGMGDTQRLEGVQSMQHTTDPEVIIQFLKVGKKK